MSERFVKYTDFSPELFSKKEPFLVSIYLQTHRHAPENEQDPIRFKNLVNEAEGKLEKLAPKTEWKGVAQNLKAVLDDPKFKVWRVAKEGMAVFADKEQAYVYDLAYPVMDRAVVANQFFIKPLVRSLQYEGHAYVLSIARDRFEVYLADETSLDRLDMPEGVKNTFSEVFPDLDDSHTLDSGSTGKQNSTIHGYGSKDETLDKETEKFFRHVGHEFNENFAREHNYPVILLGLPQNLDIFKEVTDIKNVLEEEIKKSDNGISDKQLAEKVTAILHAEYKKSVEKIVDDYGFYKSKEMASVDPSEIAYALFQKNVRTLFIEEDIVVEGYMNEETGAYVREGHENEDVSEQFLRLALLQKASVYIIPKGQMPQEAKLAAIYRHE